MRKFGEFLQSQNSSQIQEAARLMAEMNVDPWEFLLEFSRGNNKMETFVLEKINAREALLKEGLGSTIGNYAKGLWQGFTGKVDPNQQQQVAPYAGQIRAMQAAAGQAGQAIKALSDYSMNFQPGGAFGTDPSAGSWAQMLQRMVQTLTTQQQRLSGHGAQTTFNNMNSPNGGTPGVTGFGGNQGGPTPPATPATKQMSPQSMQKAIAFAKDPAKAAKLPDILQKKYGFDPQTAQKWAKYFTDEAAKTNQPSNPPPQNPPPGP